MNKLDLNKQLVQACQLPTPDLEEINKLIIAGADTNQVDENGTNIFDDVFLFSLYDVYDNDGTDDEKTLAFMKLYVVGGGGCLIRNFADYDASRVIIDEDICATAKGYEYMALVSLNRNGGAL